MAGAIGTSSESKLHLKVLGEFAFSKDGETFFPIKQQKAAALLAYIALKGGAPVSRERLSGLLWSERSEGAARTALRQCLRRLSKQLDEIGSDFLVAEHRTIGFKSADFVLDIAEICTGLARAEIPATLRPNLVFDELLHGLEDIDPSFSSWLQVAKHEWNTRILDLGQAAMHDANLSTAQRSLSAQFIFQSDPTDEAAAKILILDSLEKGSQSAALKTYKVLWDALDDAWGEEPSGELQNLIVNMKTDVGTMMPVQSRQRAGPITLVVRKFEQSGPFSQPDWMIHGFRRELIAALVRFREWHVLDETSAIDADYFVETSYRDGPNEVHLSVTVIDSTTGAYLVSDDASLQHDDWLGAMQRVIRTLSAAFNLHISRQRLTQIENGVALQAEAVDLWLQASDLLGHWRVETYERAEVLIKEIIEREPHYAPAYSSIANISNCLHLISPGRARQKTWSRKARNYAQKSVELDPMDARNQLSLAWALAMNGAFEAAKQAFELAHSLNPYNPKTVIPCAHGLSFCGEHDLANRLLDDMLETHAQLTPAHWGYAVCIRYFAGRYQDSIEAGHNAKNAIIDINCWRAAAHAMQGDTENAAHLLGTFLRHARQKWDKTLGQDPSNSNISQWFLHSFPIHNQRDFEHLQKGLSLAEATI